MKLFIDEMDSRVARKIEHFLKVTITRCTGRHINLDDVYTLYLCYRRWQQYQIEEYNQQYPYLTKAEFLAYFRYAVANLLCISDTIKDHTIIFDGIMFRQDVVDDILKNPNTVRTS